MADKSKYYQMVAEAIIAHADPIYDAIDRYLAKADEDLEDELKEEGYAEPKQAYRLQMQCRSGQDYSHCKRQGSPMAPRAHRQQEQGVWLG